MTLQKSNILVLNTFLLKLVVQQECIWQATFVGPLTGQCMVFVHGAACYPLWAYLQGRLGLKVPINFIKQNFASDEIWAFA